MHCWLLQSRWPGFGSVFPAACIPEIATPNGGAGVSAITGSEAVCPAISRGVLRVSVRLSSRVDPIERGSLALSVADSGGDLGTGSVRA